ncbi:MAG: caspase family protein [Alphaproteobacteria bacterium]
MVKNASDRWAVLIGINGYHESLGRLKYSVNDCRRLAEVLTTGDDAFPADHVLVLTDDEAAERRPTYGNIHSWLASWLSQPDEDDTVLVFFAGHGREMDGKCYLVPADATLQTIHVAGIPVPYVQELLSRCKARQKVLVLDACHSGAGRDVSTMAAPMMETLSAGKGIYTLTSCDVDELSHEWDDKRQGVFSYYLAEALSGSCPPDSTGRTSIEAVYEWVYNQVRRWASGNRCSQTPRRVAATTGSILIWPKPRSLPHKTDLPAQSQGQSNVVVPKAEAAVSATRSRKRKLQDIEKHQGNGQSASPRISVKCAHCNGTGICRNDEASKIRGNKGISCLVCWREAGKPGDLRQPITCSVCGGKGEHLLVGPVRECVHCRGKGVCLNDTASFLRGRSRIPCIPCWKAAGSPADLKRVVPCGVCGGIGSVSLSDS